MWLLAVCLPLFLSLVGFIVHRHSTEPFAALPYRLQPAAPLTVNSLLRRSDVHHSPLLSGPETVAVHPSDSSLWTGCYDGSLVRVSTADGFEAQYVSHSGWAAASSASVNVSELCLTSARAEPWLCGRPLGLLFRSASELLVADGYHGLLSYSVDSGRWQSLWNDTARDTNSVALDSGGDVAYFTSASALYRNHQVMYDVASGRCTGSVWQYRFDTGTARLLHDGLCFANGLLVSGPRLIVAETSSGRLLSLGFDDSGTRHSQRAVAVDSDRLPCLPDNLHWDKRSTTHYWVGCGSPIRAADTFDLYSAMGPVPWLRQLMVYLLPYRLIDSLARRQALVARVRIVNDSWHQLTDVLIDPDGSTLHTTTGAVWRADDDRLWFASFRAVSHSAHTSTPQPAGAPLVTHSLTRSRLTQPVQHSLTAFLLLLPLISLSIISLVCPGRRLRKRSDLLIATVAVAVATAAQ